MYKVFLVNEGKAMTRGRGARTGMNWGLAMATAIARRQSKRWGSRGLIAANQGVSVVDNSLGQELRSIAIIEVEIPRTTCCQPRSKC